MVWFVTYPQIYKPLAEQYLQEEYEKYKAQMFVEAAVDATASVHWTHDLFPIPSSSDSSDLDRYLGDKCLESDKDVLQYWRSL
jgi:hypothetical protein